MRRLLILLDLFTGKIFVEECRCSNYSTFKRQTFINYDKLIVYDVVVSFLHQELIFLFVSPCHFVVYESKVTLMLHPALRYQDVRGFGGIAPYVSNLGTR